MKKFFRLPPVRKADESVRSDDAQLVSHDPSRSSGERLIIGLR